MKKLKVFFSSINIGGFKRLLNSSKGIMSIGVGAVGLVLYSGDHIDPQLFYLMTFFMGLAYMIMTGMEDATKNASGISPNQIVSWLEIIASSNTLPKDAVKLANDALKVIGLFEAVQGKEKEIEIELQSVPVTKEDVAYATGVLASIGTGTGYDASKQGDEEDFDPKLSVKASEIKSDIPNSDWSHNAVVNTFDTINKLAIVNDASKQGEPETVEGVGSDKQGDTETEVFDNGLG